jgi:hypothetical protein
MPACPCPCTKMTATMLDINGDGAVSEAELTQSLADCAGIDAAVLEGERGVLGAAAWHAPLNGDRM